MGTSSCAIVRRTACVRNHSPNYTVHFFFLQFHTFSLRIPSVELMPHTMASNFPQWMDLISQGNWKHLCGWLCRAFVSASVDRGERRQQLLASAFVWKLHCHIREESQPSLPNGERLISTQCHDDYWNAKATWQKAFLTGDILTFHRRKSTPLTMGLFVLSVPVSEHKQYQEPEIKAAKWNSAIINFIT